MVIMECSSDMQQYWYDILVTPCVQLLKEVALSTGVEDNMISVIYNTDKRIRSPCVDKYIKRAYLTQE